MPMRRVGLEPRGDRRAMIGVRGGGPFHGAQPLLGHPCGRVEELRRDEGPPMPTPSAVAPAGQGNCPLNEASSIAWSWG